ncbi:hypothetical protein C2E23DRAFT_835051 [Lenzites betulinus]|nr:hypothetical protein C2E23DRAFT_835051 [Lenzites betulinus]
MLSDWESSLTELSSSDDEYLETKSRKKKPGPKGKKEYKVSNHLRPYRTTTYTAKSLYDQIVDNTIELDPEYQRDVVWTEAKQVGLIDSLLRNFYIPPVIFAVKRHEDNTETRTCIDGKQRLTSIQLVTGKKYYFRNRGHESRPLLSKQLLQSFANKQIVCVEYEEITDDQEREIFQRVQLGVALTVAERMQAVAGPWPSLIREVQSIVLGDDGFGEDLDWGHDRGRDFQCLAAIINLIHTHPATAFPSAPRIERWLSSPSAVPVKTREDVLDTFRIFITLVKDKRYNMAFNKPARVSPVEFTMIGVLIYRFRKTLSLKQLSQAIWFMRADVRKAHKDVRQNQRVVGTMFKFIEKGLPALELVGDGQGNPPASGPTKSRMTTSDASTPRPPPSGSGDKRRRPQDAASSASDYEEVAPRKKKPAVATSRSVSDVIMSTSAKDKIAQNKKTTRSASSKTAPVENTGDTVPKSTPSRATRTAALAREGQQASPATTSKSSTPTPQNAAIRPSTRTTQTSLRAAAASALSQVAGPSKPQSAMRQRAVPATEESGAGERMDEDPPQSASTKVSPMAPPVSGIRSGVTVSDPNAMCISNPSPATTRQTLIIDTSAASLQQAPRASLPPQTGSAVASPAESTLQASIEQLLAKHGHLVNVSITPIAETRSTNTPPASQLAGIHISSPPLPTSPHPTIPPPPPAPLLVGSPSSPSTGPPIPRPLVGQANYVAQAAPSGSQPPVYIKRERDVDPDWASRGRERERSRSRGWSRSRSRDRSKHRKDRHQDRGRDRSQGRYPSRDRERSRDRYRSPDRERHPRRDSGREREWVEREGYRGRGRGGDRERGNYGPPRGREYHRPR